MSCQPRPVPCQLTDSVVISEMAVSVTGVSWPATSETGPWFCQRLPAAWPGTGTPPTSRITVAPGSVTTLMS